MNPVASCQRNTNPAWNRSEGNTIKRFTVSLLSNDYVISHVPWILLSILQARRDYHLWDYHLWSAAASSLPMLHMLRSKVVHMLNTWWIGPSINYALNMWQKAGEEPEVKLYYSRMWNCLILTLFPSSLSSSCNSTYLGWGSLKPVYRYIKGIFDDDNYHVIS